MSVAAKVRIIDEERNVEARVEAARAWTPKAKARLARQTIVMVREFLAELEWRGGVFSDMHDDLYPRCGRDCDGHERGCQADELAGHDRLLLEIADLAGLRELLDGVEELPDPDDALWSQLEHRLAKASRSPSAWVALRAKFRREESQTVASPPPASDDVLAPRPRSREPLSDAEFHALEEKCFEASTLRLSESLTTCVGEELERRVQRVEAILATVRSEKGARDR